LTVKNLQYAYTTLETAMREVQKFLIFNNAAVEEKHDNIEAGGILDEFEMYR